jgi:acid phosphatase
MFLGRRLVLGALLTLSNVNALTARSSSSHEKAPKVVRGQAFDRLAIIWLENTDFSAALADPNLGALTKEGILLKNYFSVTHPSEPNYVATVGGDYFGMNNDNLNMIPANVSSIVDLLESKDISWAEYQEDMPSTGFQGFQFLNPDGANDYVRKHNPLIVYNSVVENAERLANIKNFTLFEQDLANNALPQWMFITPNMTDDGHDTNVTFAGTFIKRFLPPLLENPNFNSDRTLILLTFDENGSDNEGNNVFALLLGNAVPNHLKGTTDSNVYDHYSEIATVEANWNLPTLGRRDVGANVFSMVAEQTGDRLRSLKQLPLLNESYPGIFNSITLAPLPIPNTKLVVNGRRVLESIVDVWGSKELQKCTVYTGALEVPDGENPPVLPKGCS